MCSIKIINYVLVNIICIKIIFVLCFQAQMPDPKTYKQHFENKHPKNDMPEELKDV